MGRFNKNAFPLLITKMRYTLYATETPFIKDHKEEFIHSGPTTFEISVHFCCIHNYCKVTAEVSIDPKAYIEART